MHPSYETIKVQQDVCRPCGNVNRAEVRRLDLTPEDLRDMNEAASKVIVQGARDPEKLEQMNGRRAAGYVSEHSSFTGTNRSGDSGPARDWVKRLRAEGAAPSPATGRAGDGGQTAGCADLQ
jgi:hypothetical protein